MTRQATIQFLEFLTSLAPEGETALIVKQKPQMRDGEMQFHAADGTVVSEQEWAGGAATTPTESTEA